MEAAIASMTTLNKYAAQCCRAYEVHACTDVTGFSFLGHLHEMMDEAHSCRIEAGAVPVFSEALRHADEFLLTAAGQRNRNHTGPFVRFENVPFAMEEVLFDPQTSGGLLVALPKEQAAALVEDLRRGGAPAAVVGEVTDARTSKFALSDKYYIILHIDWRIIKMLKVNAMAIPAPSPW